MPEDLRFRSRRPDDTRRAARCLVTSLDERGGVVGLVGPLGAGKTEFVKGLAAGLGLDEMRITSPTFVVAHEYVPHEGPELVHADFYRVEREAELEEAGLRDWLLPGRLLVAEWSDRFPGALPADRLEVHFLQVRGEERLVGVHAAGERSEQRRDRWREALLADGCVQVETDPWP